MPGTARKSITVAQATQFAADASRIQAVLGYSRAPVQPRDDVIENSLWDCDYLGEGTHIKLGRRSLYPLRFGPVRVQRPPAVSAVISSAELKSS